MMANRYTSSSSATRKSRLDNKPSMLPVPYRPASIDRTSTDARRPSTTGMRSSSADPSRATFGGHLNREASATKLSMNGRSRSQTADHKYGQSLVTPLRTSQYSRFTTPIRTPDDRGSCSWETCLERALAFVTHKDKRQISSAAWQRKEHSRINNTLAERYNLGAMLVRPLTISLFVDIVGILLANIVRDAKLSSDNYITRLPHIAKRLLYPSPVSKSWLRTVNTPHAFPPALALIGYLLDLSNHCKMDVSEEWLYANKDELSCLRREYVNQCWRRFQEPESNYDDLTEEYLKKLENVLGNDDDKIYELKEDIKEMENCLEDEEELAGRADEARRTDRRNGLQAALRNERAAKRATVAEIEAMRVLQKNRIDELKELDVEIERANAEIERLREELAHQPMSVDERNRLLDEVDYNTRVHDSKVDLADQLSKMLLNKETELAQWQRKTLNSCVEYKQGLIQLSTLIPALANLAIDEKELMGAECAAHMARAVEALRKEGQKLSDKKAELMRTRSALSRRKAVLLKETRSKIADVQLSVQREQKLLDAELAKEATETAAWTKEQLEIKERLEQLRMNQQEYAQVEADLDFWEKQDSAWRAKLSEMRDYIEKQKLHAQQTVIAAREHRTKLVRDTVAQWYSKLGQ